MKLSRIADCLIRAAHSHLNAYIVQKRLPPEWTRGPQFIALCHRERESKYWVDDLLLSSTILDHTTSSMNNGNADSLFTGHPGRHPFWINDSQFCELPNTTDNIRAGKRK